MYFEPDARTHRPACCCATYTSTCGYKSASSNTRKRLFTGKGRQRATGRARSKVPTLNLFPARGLTEKRRKLFGGGPVSQGVAEEIYENTFSGNFLEQPLLPSHESRNKDASFLEGVPFPRGLPKRFTKTRLQATISWTAPPTQPWVKKQHAKRVMVRTFAVATAPPKRPFWQLWKLPETFSQGEKRLFQLCSAGALLVLSWCSVCSLQKEHKSPIPKGFRVQTFAVTAAPPKRPFWQHWKPPKAFSRGETCFPPSCSLR